ncbi:MAG TPA: FAD-dependent oxidoreductase [Rectinema sp.]|nr:FAD-dependent oxidoreductase [Rectinema sp.]HPG91515.1 FAD-dependent oxidoreductase [Rectinema sp.]HPN92645.1 FAD-dependent oxidoreductase [Rectinema sp.]HQL85913.1 FAD-dependent oxidoreductase [Rectinema sp.]
MKQLIFDAVVIGGGAAGMAAAIELDSRGNSVLVLDREESLGGILMQCIHNGFGLIEFDEELTGPEFAQRFEEKVYARNIQVLLKTTVLDIREDDKHKVIYAVSAKKGMMRIEARAIVLAMGCRERNRGNIRIPGTRPAGIYTAGLAQRLVNIEGYIPGKDVAIIGSGDIGLIMARRMSWSGCKVHAVIEILPYPSGLTRNIVQCLNDFNIPLYLSHMVTNIYGKDRVEGIEIAPIEAGALMSEKAFRIACDTVLLSVGLVPENELSRDAGIEIHPATNGPWVDSMLMTTMPGVFACGNVLHVHDLVDYVVEEARRAGANAAAWLSGYRAEGEIRVKTGSNIRYIMPMRVNPERENRLYMRALVVKNDARLDVRLDGTEVKSRKLAHVQPSEMLSLTLKPEDLAAARRDSTLEIALV